MSTIRDHGASAWQRWLYAAACALMLWNDACAGPVPDPASPLDSYQHTQWTAANGVPADILGMAQTSDGWLWLSTSSGLFRFDGVRFTRAPGALARARMHDLFAAPNGDLYASIFGGGLSVVHPDGRAEALANSEGPVIGTISAMTMDNDGTLWAVGLSIYRRVGQAWEALDGDPVWQESDIRSLLLDAAGTLWAASDAGIKRFDRARARFAYVDRHTGSLVQAPDGSVWVLAKDGTGARRLSEPVRGGARPPRFNPSGSRFGGIFDVNGSLWKLRCPAPVCLAAAPAAGAAPVLRNPRLALTLSGSTARQILEDREGNVWIATERGLDRFRPGRMMQSGLPASPNQSIATDAEGRTWATDKSGGLWQLAIGQAPRAVPGPPAQIVARDHDGGIVVAGARSVWRLAHGRRTDMPLPPGADGRPRDRKPFVLLDDGKIVWTAAADTSLIGWSGGRWRPWTEFNLTDKLYRLVPGGPGQMWLARGGGELVFYDNGKRTHYDAAALGWITGIFPGTDVVVAGDGGLGVLANGRIRSLGGAGAGADALRSISGLAVMPDGDRWLNGAAGLLHVRAADWRRALAAPGAELRYELFGPGDGYPGRALIENGQPSAASPDGRVVWVIGTEGVAALDTGAAHRNDARLVPQVEGVLTPRGTLADGPVRIAPGTERFAVRFTAPALRMPERLRFEYRLDEFDSGWQDGGARRAAEYTRVPPGAYRFRVRAYNEDGVPGAAEATLALRVEPTLVQTPWFKAACALLLTGLGLVLYRYRVRYLTARVGERLRVRTAERERIARTLHDSFLQSLQAMLMRLDAVTVRLDDTAARREIETIRDRANEALIEGRGHLVELRAGDVAALDEVLVRHVQQMREMVAGTEFVLRVENSRKPLREAVVEEVGAIAREALRNAAVHGAPGQVKVVLGYGRRALTLSVADTGRGLPDEVARSGGRPGHWGLAGMRERAERIGGLLVIDSHPGRGTTVRLAVPAKQAYVDP